MSLTSLTTLEWLLLQQYAKHKVFVSYHHANDWLYRDAFEKLFAETLNVYISKSVQVGEIPAFLDSDSVRTQIRDDYLRDSTVTVVLVGAETWQRRHVDWEISSSIRQTKLSTRSGLIGILLPTHPSFYSNEYDGGLVPPRLVDNQVCGFARVFKWTNNAVEIALWIQEAFDRRLIVDPDNSYPHFVNNKSGARWK